VSAPRFASAEEGVSRSTVTAYGCNFPYTVLSTTTLRRNIFNNGLISYTLMSVPESDINEFWEDAMLLEKVVLNRSGRT